MRQEPSREGGGQKCGGSWENSIGKVSKRAGQCGGRGSPDFRTWQQRVSRPLYSLVRKAMEPDDTKHLLEKTFLIFKNYPFSSKDINFPVNDTNMLSATDLSAVSPGPQLLSHCLCRTDTHSCFFLSLL